MTEDEQVRIVFHHKDERGSSFTEEWTIESSSTDAKTAAAEVYEAHQILLNGPKTEKE